MGRKGETAEDRRRLIELYNAAVRLHWERQWDEAMAFLEEALKLVPEDKPSVVLRKRIEEYRLNPPGPQWQGEYIRVAKD